MATFQPVDELGKYLLNKEVDLDSDVFKAMLTDTAPTKAGSQVKADFTEITAGNGYTTGGVTLTTSIAETGSGTGIWQWTINDPSWTASGGDIATHRYCIVYDDTHASKVVVGYIDRGSSAVITNGNTRLWDIGANGAFRLTVS